MFDKVTNTSISAFFPENLRVEGILATIDNASGAPTAAHMCNLYRLSGDASDVSRLFGASWSGDVSLAEEIRPGYAGLVTAGSEARAMTWGFLPAVLGAKGQRLRPTPVNNVRHDKLLTRTWRPSFEGRRCLIPVSAWAEPESEHGCETRTWYSLLSGHPFAVAGLWEDSDGWGRCYTMVIVPSSEHMAPEHKYMPLILAPEDWATWVAGSTSNALGLCRTPRDNLSVERTSQPWAI